VIRNRLTTTNNSSFNLAWQLYNDAFPIDERRQLYLQKLLMNNKDYNFDFVTDNGVFVGLILWWQFNKLRYIEHFAIDTKYRGKGYGKNIISQFISESSDDFILEVELPNNQINIKRINFYNQLGFKLNKYYYQQLPMQKNGSSIELLLMTYPNYLTELKLLLFKQSFKAICYDPYFL